MVESSRPSIQIDLNDFKLHLHLKNRTQLTLHFNSPSRKFYLSVIALVVNEMKKVGKIRFISLQEHLDLIALLNETIGGAAGSSEKENLLHRIYTKWKDTLPNLEEAPLFKVLGRRKEEGEGALGKIYSFSDTEKDGWANLFEYMGSEENVRLKFAIDQIGVGLNETTIIFEDSLNGNAWDQFVSILKKGGKEESEPVEKTAVPEPPSVPSSPPQKQKNSWLTQYRWVILVIVIGIVAVGFWKFYLSPAPMEVASIDRMKYPLPDKPSIAVLPFVNLSEDPKQEYFSDGMTEDIITDLSKISGLMVIARNSTSIYKGKPIKIKQVAEELGVRYVLEGSVRRVGDDIRINAQLIDAMAGHHIWGERYDGKMDRVFVLQDQITQKIASTLAVKLTEVEKERVGQKGTDNIAAYDALQEGWDHFYRFTPDSFAKAYAFFKKSIELDPNCGQAYDGLARLHWIATQSSFLLPGLKMSWEEARLRMREYNNIAMKKPTPTAHMVSTFMYLIRRQHKEAISEAERGLGLDPNSAPCHSGMGWALAMAGRPREGIEYLNKSIRLNPRGRVRVLVDIGYAYFCMGEIAEAVNVFEQALRINPEDPSPAMGLAFSFGALGRDQGARAMLLEINRKKPGTPLTLSSFMFIIPIKDRTVADWLAEGLLKAGLPPGRVAGGYFPAFKENQLTGEEIKSLLFGSRITGINLNDGQQWWVERKKNGEFTWRGPSTLVGPSSDNGKSRIESDMVCTQFQKSYWGLEYCGTVFRNPRGTYEGKDQYFFCNDIGFLPFSLVR